MANWDFYFCIVAKMPRRIRGSQARCENKESNQKGFRLFRNSTAEWILPWLFCFKFEAKKVKPGAQTPGQALVNTL